MLIRLLYVSRAVGPQTTTVTSSILATAHTANRALGISGVLCQGQGLYLQVLEGERRAVNRLYAKLIADPRHTDIELLHLEEIAERRFAQWSMAHVVLRDDDPMVQMHHPEFDPYAATGRFVMQLVDELTVSGERLQPADVSQMAGALKVPTRGAPRRLEDFDPAALVNGRPEKK